MALALAERILPIGFSVTGLPIGKRQSDFAVMQMARAYEQATGWVQKNPPPIP